MNISTIDLCSEEPIHIPGQVQSHGLLLGWGSDGRIKVASKNSFRFLGLNSKVLINQNIKQVIPRFNGDSSLEGTQQVFIHDYENEALLFQGHFFQSGNLSMVDLLPGKIKDLKDPDLKENPAYEDYLKSILDSTKFDRVLLYLFTPKGDGKVHAESRRSGGPSFLNHWFPASDIPLQARQLYIKNKIRYISDVTTPPSTLVSSEKESIDLTDSWLRAVSPIHIEYLQNMSVACSLSMSLVQNGNLFGLIACHSFRPVELDFNQLNWLSRISEKLEKHLIGDAEREKEKRINFIKENRDQLMQNSEKICHELSVDSLEIVKKSSLPSPLIHQFSDGIYLSDKNSEAIESIFGTEIKGMALVELPDQNVLALGRKQLFQEKVWGGVPSTKIPFKGNRIEPRKSFESFVEKIHDCSLPWDFIDYQTLGYFNPSKV